MLTPEESIQIQNRSGADIIMALDDIVKTTITGPRIEEAMYRTLRWIDRCIEGIGFGFACNLPTCAKEYFKQSIFPIFSWYRLCSAYSLYSLYGTRKAMNLQAVQLNHSIKDFVYVMYSLLFVTSHA